jgi:CRP-like cAMP-binding protein
MFRRFPDPLGNPNDHIHACPERARLFSGVLPDDYASIHTSSRLKQFARGQILYSEGTPVQQVLLLTAGFVKSTKLGQSGTEVIVRLESSGDVLGALRLLTTGAHSTTAQALRLCHARTWDALAFTGLMERFPVLHQNMVRIVDQYLLEMEERFREIATEKVGSRVARQLVRLVDQIGRQVSDGVEIGLSREEVAQMTGTTLFTVSRLLCEWETAGLVMPRREAVIIRDIKSLSAISGELQ